MRQCVNAKCGTHAGDPWFTDENRAVMLLTSAPTSVIEIEWFDWTEDGADSELGIIGGAIETQRPEVP